MAINHNKQAILMHQMNHPDSLHFCEDVFKVNPKKVVGSRPVDLLWASPDCFAAGTLVMTRSGLKPIEDVEVGEMVLTHRGRWRRVTEVLVKGAETVSVCGHGHYGLVTTPDHQFYSKRIVKRRAPGARHEMRTLVENPYWPKAIELCGKLWATPHTLPEALIPTCAGAAFSADFFYWVGRWVGDGSLNKGDVEICCGAAEVEEVAMRELRTPLRNADGNRVPCRLVDHGSSMLFSWGNADLARWLRTNFGDSCETKELPPWCLSMQAEWRRALLEGYRDADGHRSVRNDTSSVSKKLSVGIRLLATSLGHTAGLYFVPGRDGEIEGRPFTGKDAYRVAWYDTLLKETSFRDSLHQFTLVKEVAATGKTEPVFCLSVEEDESYVADGIVVHNCTHFSRAKGGKPKSKKIRGLAWVIVKWAVQVRPRLICMENVPEFLTWGPLDKDQQPIKERAGETFREFVGQLAHLGYKVDWRMLVAADFGAPTIRKRLFLVARCDGLSIQWPTPSYGPGRLHPYRTAAECIDWELPVPSIFDRNKPLAEATERRIAEGLRRYLFEAQSPFLLNLTHGGRLEPLDEPLRTVTGAHRGEKALVVPCILPNNTNNVPKAVSTPLPTITSGNRNFLVSAFLAKHYGGVVGHALQRPVGTITGKDHHALVTAHVIHHRGRSIGCSTSTPLPTMTAKGHIGLVAASLLKFYGTSTGSPLGAPVPTVTGQGGHVGLVAAFLLKYYGNGGQWQGPHEPLRTIVNKARFGLVTVEIAGEPYVVSDIGMRMLQPRELARAQGFQDEYVLIGTKTDQIARIGNSVVPHLAQAVVEANAWYYEK